MQQPDEGPPIPTLLYGTVGGSLGVVASLPQETFEFLQRLQVRLFSCGVVIALTNLSVQTQILEVVKGVGGLSHTEWRSFQVS